VPIKSVQYTVGGRRVQKGSVVCCCAAHRRVAAQGDRASLLLAPLMQVMGRPSWIPVPDFALATLLGEGASVVLEGQRVVPTRAQDAGFKFKYPQVRDALKAVIRRP